VQWAFPFSKDSLAFNAFVYTFYKYFTWLKRVARNKCSSLFVRSRSDKRKNVFKYLQQAEVGAGVMAYLYRWVRVDAQVRGIETFPKNNIFHFLISQKSGPNRGILIKGKDSVLPTPSHRCSFLKLLKHLYHQGGQMYWIFPFNKFSLIGQQW
jgi:hypothetical protein